MNNFIFLTVTISLLTLSCSNTKPLRDCRDISSLEQTSVTKPVDINFSKLYKNLNTDEVVIPAVRTELIYQKEVGALTCMKKINIHNGESYACNINENTDLHQQVYEVLNTKELLTLSTTTEVTYTKKSDGISCTKSKRIEGNITHQCILLPMSQYKCIAYKEMCRASFCTGGYKIVDLKSKKVVESFRLYDYGENTLSYCQSFL